MRGDDGHGRAAQWVKSSSIPKWLAATTRQSADAPIPTLIWSGVVAVICVAIGFRYLPLAPSRSELIDPSAEFHKRWLAYSDEFGKMSEIIVVVSSNDAVADNVETDHVADAAAAVETELNACSDVVDVMGVIDWSTLKSRALQFEEPQKLARLDALLERFVLPAATGRAGLAPAASRLTAQLREASDTGDPKRWQQGLEDAAQFVASAEDLLAGRFDAPVWKVALEEREFPQPNVFDGGKTRIVSCYPRSSVGLEGAAPAVDAVRSIIADLRVAHPDIEFGLTGVPVLECDEMAQSSRDMALASVTSSIGVAVLLIVGFRGRRIPLLAVATLAIAMAWSLGWAAISVGSLNILSVSFAAILIGLGVDFSLHWLAHASDAEAQLGESATSSSVAVAAAGHCGTGIATAAVTTATAFLVAGVTPFRGLAELGVIAGGGVVLCAFAAIVITPALTAMSRPKGGGRGTPRYAVQLSRLVARYPFVTSLLAIVLVAIATVAGFDVAGNFMPRVRYESNLLAMQPAGLPSIVTQQALEEATSGGLLFGVSRTKSAVEARKLESALSDIPEVGAVWSLGRLIPGDDPQRRNVVQRIAELVRQRVSPRFAPADRDDTIAALDSLKTVVELSRASDADEVAKSVADIASRLQQLDESEVRVALDGAARTIANQAVVLIEELREISNDSAINASLIPKPLRRRFLGDEGTWLVVSFPKEPIWNEQPLSAFVTALRTVDPEVTGTPIQNLEATRQIQSSYLDAFAYAFVAIALVLFLDASTVSNLGFAIAGGTAIAVFAYTTGLGDRWGNAGAGWAIAFLLGAVFAGTAFDYRGAVAAIGAATPSLLGGVVTVGSLAALGIDFNPANLIVLPLILGIGVDDGVHILHGLRGRTGRLSPATIHALTMTSLTSAVGFGSLMMAAHRGLASLGVTLVVGVGACYFVSVFFLLPIAYLIRAAQRPMNQRNPDDRSTRLPAVDEGGIGHTERVAAWSYREE